jgi:hypothetical protein
MKTTLTQLVTQAVMVIGLASAGQSSDIHKLLDSARKTVGGGTAVSNTTAGGAQSNLTNDEMIMGLKEALQVGTKNAVGTVSKVDGYYKNPDIKIPLPGEIEKAGKYLRLAGFGAEIDQFELSMNRAAEKAAPEAKQIFWEAIKEMRFEDASYVLNGPDDAATRYFRDKTYTRLQNIFKPIVSDTMATVGVTRQFQKINTKLSSIPLADTATVDIDQ